MSITKNLPAWCYCTSPRTGDVVIVTRGEKPCTKPSRRW